MQNILFSIILMKTETQVTVCLGDIRSSEHLVPQPDGFIIKAFFACSRTDTRPFSIASETTHINQTLRVVNIGGGELEFWLCTTHNKIIANATVPIPSDLGSAHEISVDFKMTTTPFALVNMAITVNKREIEKVQYVQPDEELLKKVQDPYERQKKEEEQAKKAKQLQEQQAASKQVKKAAITLTHFNKKQVPFV